MQRIKLATLLLPLLALAACTTVLPSDRAIFTGRCRFTYSDAFVERVLAPRLKAHVGEGYTNFNVEEPNITREGDKIAILLAMARPKLGLYVMDSPVVMFVVDPCTGEIVRESWD